MDVIRHAFAKGIQKGATHIHLDFMLKLLPKLPEVRTKLDILIYGDGRLLLENILTWITAMLLL